LQLAVKQNAIMSSKGYKDLIVYQKAYTAAMEIYHVSKKFSKEETYSLTDQVRRSSRSVCANIGEAYRKRICAETMIFLDFARDCAYLSETTHKELIEEYLQIGKMLGSMMMNPEKFSPKNLPTAN
jgi:hypothetical protein